MSNTPTTPTTDWLADCPVCGAIGPDYCERARCEDPRYVDAVEIKANAAFNDDPTNPTNQTTAFVRHIASPVPRPGGRPNLCGAPQEAGMSYGGLDEAYVAHVEGWNNGNRLCRDCVLTALTAMEIAA